MILYTLNNYTVASALLFLLIYNTVHNPYRAHIDQQRKAVKDGHWGLLETEISTKILKPKDQKQQTSVIITNTKESDENKKTVTEKKYMKTD